MRLAGNGCGRLANEADPCTIAMGLRPGRKKGNGLTYAQFWLRYLRAHARPRTRALHYCGSLLALAALAFGILQADWRWLMAAPVIGYGLAWAAHFGIENNRPETFGHPFWSLASDFPNAGAVPDRPARAAPTTRRVS